MIIENSDERVIGRTGISFYVVKVKCPGCQKIRSVERNRAKKLKQFDCVKCYRRSEKYRNLRKLTANPRPANFQIKCITNCLYCEKCVERSKRHLERFRPFCNSSCQIRWQNENTDFNKGENNPSFVHGGRINGRHPSYGPEFDKELKRTIKIRDRYKCQICKVNFSGKFSRYLDVHHIDENKFNNSEDNLICLCKGCHTLLHKSEIKWRLDYQI